MSSRAWAAERTKERRNSASGARARAGSQSAAGAGCPSQKALRLASSFSRASQLVLRISRPKRRKITLKRPLAGHAGSLGHARAAGQILEGVLGLDVECLADHPDGAGVRRIVPRHDPLELHPPPVVLGHRAEGRAHTLGLLLEDLVLDDDDAPLGDASVGVKKDLIDRSVDLDAALVLHVCLRSRAAGLAASAAERGRKASVATRRFRSPCGVSRRRWQGAPPTRIRCNTRRGKPRSPEGRSRRSGGSPRRGSRNAASGVERPAGGPELPGCCTSPKTSVNSTGVS